MKRGLALLTVLLLAIVVVRIASRTDRQKLAYYVGNIPSAASIHVEDNDWLRLNPEPVCFIKFSASAADVAGMLAAKSFTQTTNGTFNPPGPAWWHGGSLGPNQKVFIRDHRAKGGFIHTGKNRGWTEVVWLDESGTNVYFLVFGV